LGVAIGLLGSLASVLSGPVENISTVDPYSFLAVTVAIIFRQAYSPVSGRRAARRWSIR
jgi:hypothetical protein